MSLLPNDLFLLLLFIHLYAAALPFFFFPFSLKRPLGASYHPLHPWRLHFNGLIFRQGAERQRGGGCGRTISMPDTRRDSASSATPRPERRIRPQPLHRPNI